MPRLDNNQYGNNMTQLAAVLHSLAVGGRKIKKSVQHADAEFSTHVTTIKSVHVPHDAQCAQQAGSSRNNSHTR